MLRSLPIAFPSRFSGNGQERIETVLLPSNNGGPDDEKHSNPYSGRMSGVDDVGGMVMAIRSPALLRVRAA